MVKIVISTFVIAVSVVKACTLDDGNVTEACIKELSTQMGTSLKALEGNATVQRDGLYEFVNEADALGKKYTQLLMKIEASKMSETEISKYQTQVKSYQEQTTQIERTVQNMLVSGDPAELFDINLILGVQLQPSYDSNGTSKGFNHSTLYAKINIDSRFGDGLGRNGNKSGWTLFSMYNFGIDLEYLGTPVENNETSVTAQPTGFNDVSNTFQTIVYGGTGLYHVRAGSDISLLAQVGGMSRDKKDQNENTINKFYGGGIEYVYSDLITKTYYPSDSTLYNKRYPKAKISLVYRRYDFFAGAEDVDRAVMDFEYKIGTLLVGFNANVAGVNDTLYLKFGFVKSVDDLVAFFTTK